jgi:hypothetical protein
MELYHGPDIYRLCADDDACELLGAKNFGKVPQWRMSWFLGGLWQQIMVSIG